MNFIYTDRLNVPVKVVETTLEPGMVYRLTKEHNLHWYVTYLDDNDDYHYGMLREPDATTICCYWPKYIVEKRDIEMWVVPVGRYLGK